MELNKLVTWQFRNLEDISTELTSGQTMIFGSNGQGKTNFLEALAVAGNISSFRQASARKMVRHGEGAFRIETWVEGLNKRTHLCQIVEIGAGITRKFEINGVGVPMEQYLVQCPVFTLSSEDKQLVLGSPERRRSFVDRMAFFLDSNHFGALTEYKARLKQRNAALVGQRPLAEMELWEDGLAKAAAGVVDRRSKVVDQWRGRFRSTYQLLRGEGFPNIEAVYRTEAGFDGADREKVAEFYRQRYDEHRVRDCRAGFTLEGPHRHDLSLRAGDRPARDVLSAGQVKIVAAALWMSNLAQVEERRNEHLPVLIDDADAELDDRVFAKLVDSLGRARQVIMTTAHDRGIRGVIPAAIWWSMTEGRVQKARTPAGI